MLDSVSSPITQRVYNMALDEFMGWFQQAPRPPAEAQFGFLLGVPNLPATGSAQGRQLAPAAPHPRVIPAGGWSGLGDGFGTAGPLFGTRDGRHLFARASRPGSRGRPAMGQVQASKRWIARGARRTKLIACRGDARKKIKKSDWEGIWLRPSLQRAMVSVWITRARSMRVSRSANIGLL